MVKLTPAQKKALTEDAAKSIGIVLNDEGYMVNINDNADPWNPRRFPQQCFMLIEQLGLDISYDKRTGHVAVGRDLFSARWYPKSQFRWAVIEAAAKLYRDSKGGSHDRKEVGSQPQAG